MSQDHTPVTAGTSLFTFYDIESLSNVFSMCAFTPEYHGETGFLEVFFLVDDAQLLTQFDREAMIEAITASNPGLPEVIVREYDLSTAEANLRLAQLLGLSDASPVGDVKQKSSYPTDLRPVCDTDENYDPKVFPFLAGYNSLNYDTTMLALYLSEVFSVFADYRTQCQETQRKVAQATRRGDHADAQALLRELEASRPTTFQAPSAQTLRRYNDQLFSDEYIDYMPRFLQWGSQPQKIRQSMLNSGRHLDVARLNEAQYMVGLKRLLGLLGYQIKESEKLGHDSTITTIGDLYELLAYNVSDCLGLSQLFKHPTYSSNFDLKAGLLHQYSETVYAKNGGIRLDRLSIDSSSAKFVGRILSPYGHLQDIETVSFNYPHAEVAAERGTKQVNVLDECVRFFETEVAPDRQTNPAQAKAHQRFMEVVNYYRSIEGKNFNDSEEYGEVFDQPSFTLPQITKTPNNLPYFTADGTPSSCFATFSYGGIHGAEANMSRYQADSQAYSDAEAMIKLARHFFPQATDFTAEAKRQRDLITLPDGTTMDKSLVLYGSDPEKVKFRKPKKGDEQQNAALERAMSQCDDPAALLATLREKDQELDVILDDPELGRVHLRGKTVLAKQTLTGATYRDAPSMKKPELFTEVDPDGTKGKIDRSTKLDARYGYTSAGLVIHEDFTSYYPNLLRNMRAFYNPELGEDRYAKIFFDKERYGKEMKTPGIAPEEKTRLNTLRNGTKLILNSASGAGDAQHKNPIRMNNQIISMRIIGQLFSWMIGQAQALAGARIISTNTDGLYSVIDDSIGYTIEVNNRVLAERSAAIGVEIEPEPMFLISKDSNNRLELIDPDTEELMARPVTEWEIAGAGGGTLACHGGPRPDKSLAHPAVIDFALANYLQTVAGRGEEHLREDFDPELGRKILEQALDLSDPVKTATMFQNVVAASRGSITYPFAADPIDPDADEVTITGHRALQMVNRVFIVRNDTEGAVSLHNAGAWKVSPASAERRAKEHLASVERSNPIAREILAFHGWATDRQQLQTNPELNLIPEDQDVVTRKINSIDPTWAMRIVNDDLHALDQDALRLLLSQLDLDIYLRMLEETFTNNWKNV